MISGLKLRRGGTLGSQILIPLVSLLIIIAEASAFDCRVFIFHPECRGHMGKRSGHQDGEISTELQTENLNKLLQALEERNREEYEEQNGLQTVDSYPIEEGYGQENFHDLEKPLYDWIEQVYGHHNHDTRSRIKREAFDSFTSFYLPKYGAKAEERIKRDLLKTFSTFYLPPTTKEARRDKRHVLNSFSTFFKSKPSQDEPMKNNRIRRNILDSFSTFSSPRVNGRNKRESLDYFSSFYLPKSQDRSRSKRNVLESFNGFYLPKGKKNLLDTFTSFYKTGRDNREKRDVDEMAPIYSDEDLSPAFDNVDIDPTMIDESDRNKREILEPFTSFYKVKNPKNSERGKRQANISNLGSFTSFYLPKALSAKDQGRNKRSVESVEEQKIESGLQN